MRVFDGRSFAALHPRPESLESAARAVPLGGWVRPDQGSGVIVASGGQIRGMSLYLEEGVLHLALRANNRLKTIRCRGSDSHGRVDLTVAYSRPSPVVFLDA